MASRYLLRWLGNFCNLSTPAGLLVARAGGCRLRIGPRGLLIAEGYRPRFPFAYAFTLGNVILIRGRASTTTTDLFEHEDAHAWQYLAFGPFFLPAYALATAWSWLRSGDRAAYNIFERRAGLARGGYRTGVPLRRIWSPR
ncbi:hypothetical protein AADG42_05460 [Ammonicoccus fulvus]|uniref:DUF4157 domain-containing protein n=1 Tax=Ammonicoccus fulvus TaxID=3138240 RepID=A0ABZ3FL50_9ACTN